MITHWQGGVSARPLVLCLLVVAAVFLLATGPADPNQTPGVAVLELDGPIGPASSRYAVRGLATAAEGNAPAVIVRLDTPGGLDTSMREIIRAILASPVPVVVYVAPSGAHAASAGTYILYASHVAAMAPGTNLGAATPVPVGGPGFPPSAPGPEDRDGNGKDDATGGRKPPPSLGDKAVSDAVAYIRSLAQMRGRNMDWAEKAVQEAASLSAEDAFAQNVIEIIARDEADLLAKLDGREVMIEGRAVRLNTADAGTWSIAPDWRTRLLGVITNPTVASILMLIGIYGLILEFYSPGLVGPGVIGAISLLLALYAFHLLPIDYTGLALVLLGIALMVAEALTPAFGVLGLGGLVAFVFGSILLIEEDVPGWEVAWPLVGTIAALFGGTFFLVMTFVIRARKRPIVAGREELPGSLGSALTWSDGEGTVRVHGEVWRARSSVALAARQTIRVTGVHGLTLIVEPATEPKEG